MNKTLILTAGGVLFASVALAQTLPAAGTPSTQDFVNKVAISDMFEIQSSQLALAKQADADTKPFAEKMVQDHQKTSSELKALVDGGKVKATLPTALDTQHQKMLDELKAKDGKDFDASYDQTQLKAHQDAVALFDAYAKGGDNAELKWLGVQDATSSPGASQHGGEAEVARGWLRRPRRRGLSTSRQAFMPPHACLLRGLGRHAFCVAPAPPVDHAHRPLHCKVSVSRHVSLLWSGRVHGPYPLIVAERPSELIPNAAMFHDASRECPPRDPRILNRSVTGVDEVFRRNQKILPKKRYTMPPIRATRLRSEDTEIPGMARPGQGRQDDQEDVILSAWRGSSRRA
jgi:putative membrane protein